MQHKFFESDLGQQFLLLFVPFFLSPRDFQGVAYEKSLFRYFYLRPIAPLLGAFFLTSSLLSFYRFLSLKGFPFLELIDLGSAKVAFSLVVGLALLGYGAALARFSSGFLVSRVIKEEKETLKWPLAFWLSYYGGTYMVIGLFIWLILGILIASFAWWMTLILGTGLLMGAFYVYLELRLLQERRRRRTYYRYWNLFNSISISIFIFYLFLIFFLIQFIKNIYL